MTQADRREGGDAGSRVGEWVARWRPVVLGAAVLLAASPPIRLPAQVGHSTDHSPFHDIKRGATLIVGAAYVGGSRGVLGVGPSGGRLGSLRYEVPFGPALAFSLGGAVGQGSRYVADPSKNQAQHISGPVNITMGIFDATARLMLTGPKTWHGFAPYLGAFAGFVFGSTVTSDKSGYEFRTKATYGPDLGLRVYPSRRVALRIDGRLAFWRLNYPLAFKQPSPDGSRVLDVNADDHETTRHPWIGITLAWTH